MSWLDVLVYYGYSATEMFEKLDGVGELQVRRLNMIGQSHFPGDSLTGHELLKTAPLEQELPKHEGSKIKQEIVFANSNLYSHEFN
jgi:hypothetical protein